VYCAEVELLPEETYYWNYSRHLDFGYLDHPPMVAWLIRLGTLLFGNTEFGVRFGALCCGVVASIFVFRLARNLFDEASALLALVLAQILPFFFFSGMLMTPDAPLVAAWAASLYFLERALVAGRANAWAWAGLCMGLGLLSKYTIGLLGLSALLFMLLDPSSRGWWRRREPYTAVLIAAAVFAPVILWNAQHDWASFAFQTSRRLAERPRFSLHKLIGGAIVLMTPTGLAAVAAVFIRGRPRPAAGVAPVPATPDTLARRWRFMQLALFAPLAVFFFFSLRHEVKLDWTGAPWVAALPMMALGIAEAYRGRAGQAGVWQRAAWPPTLVALLLMFGAGLYYLVLGIPGIGYSTQMELVPVGWREFGRQIDEVAGEVRRRYGGLLVVGMDRYAIASELAFYSHDQPKSVLDTSAAHLFGDMGLMYEQWFQPERQAGRPLLLVAWSRDALAAPHLERQVERLEDIHEGTLMHDGRLIRHYYYRVALGYRGAPTAARVR
jgi:dolichol-phosphate mannosyltransferase